MLLFLVYGSLTEYFDLLGKNKVQVFRGLGIGLGVVNTLGVLWAARHMGTDAGAAFSQAFLAAGCCSMFLPLIFGKKFVGVGHQVSGEFVPPLVPVSLSLLGLVYIPFLSSFLALLLYLTPRETSGSISGHYYIFFLIAVTKFSDCGAYLLGSWMGKTPMVPRISPNKTWEGFVGALLVPMLVAWTLYRFMPGKLALLHSELRAVLLAFGLALAAVIGDLAESVIKRATGAKDSGRFLPGIGGALDLIDSLLFTGPPFYFYLRYFTA